MKDSLQHKTINAISWTFIETVGINGIQFIIGIILARLLHPNQFGLIGMLTIFMAVAQTFMDSGFGSALIQKRNVTQKDICSIFYFNIIVAIIMIVLLFIAAPWIATFYKQPILSSLLRALSLIIFINSFGLIQTTIITKQIDFKILSKRSIIASLLSGIIGVGMAILGFGVWSLVFQQITRAFFRTFLLWIFSSWRPSLNFSLKSLREMFRFGSRMLASGILEQIFSNIYFLIIGKLFSAADLGYYTRAQTLQDLPSRALGQMVSRVTFPIFSTIQDDHDRLKRGMKKALISLACINFPLMIGISIVARPLIIVLLTEKWIESIPYLQSLCFLGFFYPLHLINLNMLQSLGKSHLFFRLEVIKKVLIVINIAITWRWGILAMINGMIVTSIINYFLNSYYNKMLINYSFREQLYDLLPYFSISALMGCAIYLVGLISFQSYWLLLIIQVLTGVIIYVSLCLLFRLIVFREISYLVLSKIKNFIN